VTCIFSSQPYVEIEYMIEPIPTDDGHGKGIVIHYATPIASQGTFYTNFNGHKFMERQCNY